MSGSCFLSTPSQLQMSSPGCGKMVKSSSCLDGWAPDPAWERSCSWALVTPLITTKQYHSASENKICIYVTSPSSPALPSRDSRGLCYRHGATVVACWLQANICWGLTTLRASGETRGGGWGRSRVGGVGNRTHTHNHTLRPGSSEKDAQVPLGTQQGVQACATQLDTHRHWKGGARCPREFSA